MSELIARWHTVLVRCKLSEDQYQSVAEKLDVAAQAWRSRQPFAVDLSESYRFITEEMRWLLDGSLCCCNFKTVLSKGCQCGGN